MRRLFIGRGVFGLLVAAVLVGASAQAVLPAGAAAAGASAAPTDFGLPGCDIGSPQQPGLQPGLLHLSCPQPVGRNGEYELRHQYVGHDEPEMRFISSSTGTGNMMTYRMVLPTESTAPGAVPTYQDAIALWFGMPLCDPQSYPQQPCTADSDTNTGVGISASDAGSAFLELQLYPPGAGCDTTHWCAAQVDWSLECTFGYKSCNPKCTEIPNFGFIQTDGVPTGPPSPQLADAATFTPDQNTLLMNPGDTVDVSIHDTPNGLFTGIHDPTTGISGFMVASIANGFMNTNVHSCHGTPFAFHPEYSSASQDNIVPWTDLQAGPGLAVETGHYEVADGDADDTSCQPQTACSSTDFDYDGIPYVAGHWPTGLTPTSTTPSAFSLLPLAKHALGPVSNGSPYPTFELESIAGFGVSAVSSCDLSQPNQCSVDNIGSLVPTFGGFYPFYSASGCTATFGDVTGKGANDFGGIAGYGPTVARYFGTSTPAYGTNGAFYTNRC